MPLFPPSVVSPAHILVDSGTLTTTPSGTQNVAVTSPATFPVSGSVATFPALAAGTNFYTTSFTAVLGQVGATYNFLSLFNPAASGKTITVYASFIIPWATAATTTTNSMETFRTTAASAGTLTSGSGISKFTTSSPNSIAEVRTVNPTITVNGPTLGGIPPAVTSAGSGLGGIGNIGTPSGASYTLLAGEGVCMRQIIAGTANQLWNLGYIWAEA